MNILIVKTSSLGDIIHAFPTISYLKKKFPDAKIDWVVEKSNAELPLSHPFVNEVHIINTKGWRKNLFNLATYKEILSFRKKLQQKKYDLVFDLQGNTKSAFVTFLSKSKAKIGYGYKTVWEKPNLFTTHYKFDPPLNLNVRKECLYLAESYFKDNDTNEDENIALKISHEQKEKIETILSKIPNKKKIMICPGSIWVNKQMTEEALLNFLKHLYTYLNCTFLFTWGSTSEKEVVDRLSTHFQNDGYVIEKLPLPTLQNLMGHMDLVIAMDSLPLHLAGTTKTPTYSIFGSSSSNKYKPFGTQHFSFQGPCPYNKTFERRCPLLRSCKTGLCIRGLNGDELFNHLKKIINNDINHSFSFSATE